MIGGIQRMVSCKSPKRQLKTFVPCTEPCDTLGEAYHMAATAEIPPWVHAHRGYVLELDGQAIHEAPFSTDDVDQELGCPTVPDPPTQNREGAYRIESPAPQETDKPLPVKLLPQLQTDFDRSRWASGGQIGPVFSPPYNASPFTYTGFIDQPMAQPYGTTVSTPLQCSPYTASRFSSISSSSTGYSHSVETPSFPGHRNPSFSDVVTASQNSPSGSFPWKAHAMYAAPTLPDRAQGDSHPSQWSTTQPFGPASVIPYTMPWALPSRKPSSEYHSSRVAHTQDAYFAEGLTDAFISPPHSAASSAIACETVDQSLTVYTGVSNKVFSPLWHSSSHPDEEEALSSTQDVQQSPSEHGSLSIQPFEPPELRCEHCGKLYRGVYNRGNLAGHKRHKHFAGQTRHQTFPCGRCDKIYNRQDARKRHWWKKHRIGSKPAKRVKQLGRLFRRDKTSTESLPQFVEMPTDVGPYA